MSWNSSGVWKRVSTPVSRSNTPLTGTPWVVSAIRYLAERGFIDVRASRLGDAAAAGVAYEKDVRVAGEDARLHGVVRAANVVILVRAEGPREIVESFWEALLERCERAAPGEVRALTAARAG